MAYITANKKTFLKKRDAQSIDLKADEIITISPGDSLGCTVFPGYGQSLKIYLAGDSKKYGLKAAQVFYVYAPDWDIKGLASKQPIAPTSIRLEVPYFAQNDTDDQGFRECCAHSNAMMCAFMLGQKFFTNARSKGYNDQPELYYINRQKTFGDTTDHNVQTQALQFFGIESEWRSTISADDIFRSLTFGVPMVIGTRYKRDGHIVLIVGLDKQGNYLIHDPNGRRNGSSDEYFVHSTNTGKEGAYDTYTPTTMQSVFWDLGRENGYGRIVTSVDRIMTGL